MRRLLLAIILLLLPMECLAGVPGFMRERMGTLEGQVVVNEKPLRDALVSFFNRKNGPPPTVRGARRIPDSLSRTDKEGKFKVKLVPGDYYIGALDRPMDDGPGPPRPGEKFYFALNVDNTLRSFAVLLKQYVNVGVVFAALPENLQIEDVFTISGRIVTEEGKPFAGAIVTAKDSPKGMRPNFISSPTLADGTFSFMVPTGKQYYLMARETLREARPEPGSYIGKYGVTSQAGATSPNSIMGVSPPPGVLMADVDSGVPKAIGGKDGEVIENVDIIMFKVPDPAEIKAGIQGTANSPKLKEGTAINNIFFASNSEVLSEDSYPELDKWLSFIKGKPGLSVRITGHTDNIGPTAYNKDLSEKRAQRVADYFVGKGLPTKRISVAGMGADKPVASNDTPEGRQKNRRVVMKFFGM